MSEKRFKLIKPLGTRLGLKDIFIKDTKEDYYYSAKEDVVDLLNELSEEIERLNKELNKIEKLQRSKAYWKKQCKEWEKNWEDLAYEFARVNNMNKELSKDLED